MTLLTFGLTQQCCNAVPIGLCLPKLHKWQKEIFQGVVKGLQKSKAQAQTLHRNICQQKTNFCSQWCNIYPPKTHAAVSFPLKSMREWTSAAAPALTGLRAPLQQNTHCFYFGHMPQQFGTIHHLRDRKSGVKRIIREIAKIKSPIFRAIFVNCAKGFPLKLTGPRSCWCHLARQGRRFVIEVQNHIGYII